MSSLAAVQADGFYYPPTWDPSQGSVSKAAGSKGSNQYEMFGIIRFELPYNAWCEGCGRPIGKGTRFNAKKDQAGMYYTTKIWAFSMKCPSCKIKFVIKTDPKNRDYEFAEGIRRKEQKYDADDAEVLKLDSERTQAELFVDPMFCLEHKNDDVQVSKPKKSQLSHLLEWSDCTRMNDYDLNCALRKSRRGDRRERKALDIEAEQRGLGISLLPISEDDTRVASSMGLKQSSRSRNMHIFEKSKMAEIRNASIFTKPGDKVKGCGKNGDSKSVLVKKTSSSIALKREKMAKRLRLNSQGASSNVPAIVVKKTLI